MPVAAPRTKAVAHYIISHTQPNQLGASKLRKVMWAADVAFYREFGRTITDQDSYVPMPYGPVPNGLAKAICELETERKVAVNSVPTLAGDRTEYAPLERLGAAGFSADEIEAIHGAIDYICPMSAKEASDETHTPLWRSIENGMQIPVRAAAVIPGELTPEDIEWTLEAAAAEIQPAG